MSASARTVVVAAMVLSGASTVAAQTIPNLRLDAEGRTVAMRVYAARDRTVSIAVPQSASTYSFTCRADHPERGSFRLTYRFESGVVQPYAIVTNPAVLGARTQRAAAQEAPGERGDAAARREEETAARGDAEADGTWDERMHAVVFEIPIPRGSRFLLYNLLQRQWEATPEDLRACGDQIEAALVPRTQAAGRVEQAKRETDASSGRLKELERRLLLIQQEIVPLQQGRLEGALTRIDRLQEELRRVYDQRGAEEQVHDDLARQLDNARSALSRADSRLRKDWNAGADDLETRREEIGRRIKTGETNEEYALRKISGVTLAPDVNAVYHDFSVRQSGSTIGLSTLGEPPLIRYGNSVYSVLANVVPARHPFGFFLSASTQPGAVVNVAPVRPTFAASAQEPVLRAESGGIAVTGAESAYTDVFLPVQGDFKPNDILEVTITTERADDKDAQKRMGVVLVDKAKYPQMRALYRYNFNSGVIVSNLRDTRFVKVRTVADDPATAKVDESRYRVDAIAEARPVKPVFAFTCYWKAVDIQAPVTMGERLRPNPTFGFALTNPADDAFVGFTHEVARNMSLFWGAHIGLVNELLARDDVTEDGEPTAPPTRKVRRTGFAIGVTLNLTVVTKIFH